MVLCDMFTCYARDRTVNLVDVYTYFALSIDHFFSSDAETGQTFCTLSATLRILSVIVTDVCYSLKYVALFCVEPHLMRLAVTMFILGVGTSPGGKARVGKSNTMNAGVGGGRPLTSPAPGSVGRRSTISYDQAKTSSSSTERTNEVPRYSGIQLYLLEMRAVYPYEGKINQIQMFYK